MNILLIALGSHGDVHPFVGLGIRLRDRGHAVRVAANAHFESLIKSAGLSFLSLSTEEEYRRLTADADLWHPTKAFRFIFEQGVLPFMRQMYDLVVEHARSHPPGEAVVVASSLALGARIAEDRYGIPMATVHLSPAVIRSAFETPILAGAAFPDWMPKPVKNALFGLADLVLIDRTLAGPVNDVRREVGLHPVKGIIKDWIHSPRLTLGLFPEWFAAPQPDWPSSVRVTGFPLYDERGLKPMPSELEQFLNGGTPPIAFTPGSAMWLGRSFFQASAEACRLLGRRGILLSRHHDHIPAPLPAGVIHVDYAPFSELLPRCAALVHHGGIGTCAQALAAGTRQIVMPMAHDQFDNAARLKRLGVAEIIPVKRFHPRRLADELAKLLDSSTVTEQCAAVAKRFEGQDAIDETCDLIEGLVSDRNDAPRATGNRAAQFAG